MPANDFEVSKRAEKVSKMIEEGRIIRGEWTDRDAAGRSTACLLAAISPECGAARSADACPASVMPAWLALLTPWIDDSGSLAAWPATIRRYAAVAARWHVLTPDDWHRLDYRVRALCVREAARHTTDAGALAVSERVAALCDGVATGGDIDVIAFRAEAEAAWAAAEAGAAAAREAATWASAAVMWAAAAAVAGAAAWVAREAAVDRLTSQILAAIEDDCAAPVRR